jgi:hypothetical protein
MNKFIKGISYCMSNAGSLCYEMKAYILLFMLFFFLSCNHTQPKPPLIITEVSEGDGCCDIIFKDSAGNTGSRCKAYRYLKIYKPGDTLK